MYAVTHRFALRTRTWFGALLTLALVLASLPLSALPAGAVVDTGAEARFLQLINQERAGAGLGGLSMSAELVAVAREHSAEMGGAGDLYHNPNLESEVVDWLSIGENVGRGPSVSSLHDAFMASPGHRENILYHKYTQVGIGVEVVEGRIWVTQVFRKPGYVPEDAPDPEPTPEPDPEPDPVSDPEPEPESDPEPVAEESVTRESLPEPADDRMDRQAESGPRDPEKPAAATHGQTDQRGRRGVAGRPRGLAPGFRDGFGHAALVQAQLRSMATGQSLRDTLKALRAR